MQQFFQEHPAGKFRVTANSDRRRLSGPYGATAPAVAAASPVADAASPAVGAQPAPLQAAPPQQGANAQIGAAVEGIQGAKQHG
eukprot:4832419-Alexandrium_andersonii.AAC.1